MADVCALSLIGAIVGVFLSSSPGQIALLAADALLLFSTIVVVYKSQAPWADSPAKWLVRVVFGSAFLFNVVVPLLSVSPSQDPALVLMAVVPYVVVYAFVFPYLFWLEHAARKGTVRRAVRGAYLYSTGA